MNEKRYFELFTKHQGSNFDLYNKIKELVMDEIIDARGNESAKFYETLRKLSDSENNAGWESRHSDRIALIDKSMSEIVDDYEKYLP